MIREGDHRIKNSLQVVASLLRLQAQRETNGVARDALNMAMARIQAVALIHNALQLNGGVDDVDLGTLIATIAKSLDAMAGAPDSIDIIVRADPIQVPFKIAQPLILAVNELVINALRHGFPDGRSGAVTVAVIRDCDNRVQIDVSDNGVGIADGCANGHGYGMSLVRAMVGQVGGRLDTQCGGGARFTLSAPLPGASAIPAPALFIPDRSPVTAAC